MRHHLWRFETEDPTMRGDFDCKAPALYLLRHKEEMGDVIVALSVSCDLYLRLAALGANLTPLILFGFARRVSVRPVQDYHGCLFAAHRTCC